MKRIISVILVAFVMSNCAAQLSQKSQYPLVHVKDWGSLTMWIVDEGWVNIKDQIVKQVGQTMYEDIRAHYDFKTKPPQMTFFDGHHKKDMNEYNKKLDSLQVLYKVATYDYVFRGKSYGKYDILMVPYKGNEDWDKAAKWDTVYFILPAKDIEEIK